MENQSIEFSSFYLFITFISVIYWQKSLCFPEFCVAKKQAMDRSIFWAGPETSTLQQSMSRHVEGSRRTSAGLGLSLLRMGLQHRHNEHCWILERRVSVEHQSSLFPLHHSLWSTRLVLHWQYSTASCRMESVASQPQTGP